MSTIAIDFGTSNTVVSFWEPDTQAPKTLRFPGLSRLFSESTGNKSEREVAVVPSLVYVQNATTCVVGETVRSQRLGISQPQRFFRGFKRDLAADFRPPARTIDSQVFDGYQLKAGKAG